MRRIVEARHVGATGGERHEQRGGEKAQIAHSTHQFSLDRRPARAALAAWLAAAWPGPAHRHFDDVFFDGDAKEAVAFALLGYLTLHGQPGNLPAVTGAAGRRVLGMVTPA